MFFEMETPYLDMYMTRPFKKTKSKSKFHSVVLRRQTCPLCGSKLVNLYCVDNDKYICNSCIEKIKENGNDKL